MTEVEAVWVCANCGTPGAKPIASPGWGSFRPFDDREQPRYTRGYCDTCSKPTSKGKARKTPRPVSDLVDARHFDREKFEERKDRAELTRLVKAFAAGGNRVNLTDHEILRLFVLSGRFGTPGFVIPPEIRKQAMDYAAKGGK